jgi:hypothetical protein
MRQYYDLPSLSLRAAAWHLMSAGVPGFKVRWWGGSAQAKAAPQYHKGAGCSA